MSGPWAAPGWFGFDKEISTRWITTIAVEGSVEVEIAKVVTLGVKVTYEHSVETELKTVEKMSVKAAPRHGGRGRRAAGRVQRRGLPEYMAASARAIS